MRTSAIGRVFALFALLGAITVTTATDVPGQDKKEEKYPEKLTVRVWDKHGKKFLNPQNVTARKVVAKGDDVYFYIPVKQISSNTDPVTGSEFTDATGVAWVSKSSTSTGQGEYRVVAVKKP